MREWIEMASVGIELLVVVVIVGSVTFGSLRFLLDLSRRTADPYGVYKDLIGRSLLLGLEFLVAADVIRTVALSTHLPDHRRDATTCPRRDVTAISAIWAPGI
jgi:uncharacterized membrane protein